MLKPVGKLPSRNKLARQSKVAPDVREFVRNRMEVAEVFLPDKSAKQLAQMVRCYLGHHADEYPGVGCVQRGEKVYLVREGAR